MKLKKRQLASAVTLATAISAVTVPASVASAAAVAPVHGTVQVWVNPSNGGAGPVNLTGAIGDAGLAVPATSLGHIVHGSNHQRGLPLLGAHQRLDSGQPHVVQQGGQLQRRSHCLQQVQLLHCCLREGPLSVCARHWCICRYFRDRRADLHICRHGSNEDRKWHLQLEREPHWPWWWLQCHLRVWYRHAAVALPRGREEQLVALPRHHLLLRSGCGLQVGRRAKRAANGLHSSPNVVGSEDSVAAG